MDRQYRAGVKGLCLVWLNVRLSHCHFLSEIALNMILMRYLTAAAGHRSIQGGNAAIEETAVATADPAALRPLPFSHDSIGRYKSTSCDIAAADS
jgi:hypothetical protein